MSRTMRVSPAMSLADSILQTASITRWVSTDDTIPSQTRRENAKLRFPSLRPPWGPSATQLVFRGRLGAHCGYDFVVLLGTCGRRDAMPVRGFVRPPALAPVLSM